MQLEDHFLNKDILNYVAQHSNPENALNTTIRQWTETHTPVGQMICGPLVGQFLNFMIRLINAKKVIEVGTFTGYSALYMASGMPEGDLVTCEVDERHANKARSFFDQTPHGHKIDLRLGPAIKTLDSLEGPFDFAFVDADKKNYPNYYENLIPKLRSGGMMVIDNVVWGSRVLAPRDLETKTIASLNDHIQQDSRVDNLMLPVRDGLMLCIKK